MLDYCFDSLTIYSEEDFYKFYMIWLHTNVTKGKCDFCL